MKKSHGIFIIYKYAVRPRWNIGIVAGYEKISKDVYWNSSLDYHKLSKFYTTAIESEFRYIRRENLQVYSGGGLGLLFRRDEYDYRSESNKKVGNTFATAHLILVGIRDGTELSPFLELGLGYRGMVNGGLSYRY